MSDLAFYIKVVFLITLITSSFLLHLFFLLEEIFTPDKEVQNFIQLFQQAHCSFHELRGVSNNEDHSSQ